MCAQLAWGVDAVVAEGMNFAAKRNGGMGVDAVIDLALVACKAKVVAVRGVLETGRAWIPLLNLVRPSSCRAW
jgi:hypothetical protein